MHIEKGKIRHGIDGRWMCYFKGCRKTKSIFDDTMFKNSHIPISTTLRIIYMYCMGISTIFIVEETDVSRQAIYVVIDHLLHKVDSGNYNNVFNKLSLQETIVEVDETHVCTRRDGRGRILPGEKVWVIGAICRRTKMIALKVTQRRSSSDCVNFIKDHVNPGIHIVTDCCRGYSQLCNNGYEHNTINHKLHFVDPDNPLIHTQTIERLWKDFKSTCVNTNDFKFIVKAANRYVFIKNMGLATVSTRFMAYLSLNT